MRHSNALTVLGKAEAPPEQLAYTSIALESTQMSMYADQNKTKINTPVLQVNGLC